MSANRSSGFSLNGTHRNQGYVGQTSLSRSIIRTPHKGATPKGHGGCCGTYPTNIIKESTTCCTEDASVVKTSSINTHGLIDTNTNGPHNIIMKPDATKTMDTRAFMLPIWLKRKLTVVLKLMRHPMLFILNSY